MIVMRDALDFYGNPGHCEKSLYLGKNDDRPVLSTGKTSKKISNKIRQTNIFILLGFLPNTFMLFFKMFVLVIESCCQQVAGCKRFHVPGEFCI